MDIIQKKLGRKVKFLFHPDYVNMVLKDSTGTADVDVFYSEIPIKRQESIEQNGWLLYLGSVWLVIWLVNAASRLIQGQPMDGSWILLVIASPFLLFYLLSRVKYTVLPTNHGTLFIIKDKQHNLIYDEMMSRRKKALLTIYGEINTNNAPKDEIEKFQWLHRQGVLDTQELDDKLKQLTSAYKESNSISETIEIH